VAYTRALAPLQDRVPPQPFGEIESTLRRELGDAFLRVEFEGRQHATLTAHRQQEAVDRVLAFFTEHLGG
jgi:hypothetical protein